MPFIESEICSSEEAIDECMSRLPNKALGMLKDPQIEEWHPEDMQRLGLICKTICIWDLVSTASTEPASRRILNLL